MGVITSRMGLLIRVGGHLRDSLKGREFIGGVMDVCTRACLGEGRKRETGFLFARVRADDMKGLIRMIKEMVMVFREILTGAYMKATGKKEKCMVKELTPTPKRSK